MEMEVSLPEEIATSCVPMTWDATSLHMSSAQSLPRPPHSRRESASRRPARQPFSSALRFAQEGIHLEKR